MSFSLTPLPSDYQSGKQLDEQQVPLKEIDNLKTGEGIIRFGMLHVRALEFSKDKTVYYTCPYPYVSKLLCKDGKTPHKNTKKHLHYHGPLLKTSNHCILRASHSQHCGGNTSPEHIIIYITDQTNRSKIQEKKLGRDDEDRSN